MSTLNLCDLGTRPYGEVLALQEQLREARIAETIDDTLLLVEHPPVVTRGRRSREEELLMSEAFFAAQGVEVVTTQRGGLATYHGPGMLVGYPIAATTDVVDYLRRLEEAIIGALAEIGVAATQRPSTPDENLTGVWVGGPEETGSHPQAGEWRKIASLGVHVSRGVAIHGFAIGADNDLTPWEWFTPCGLPSVRMTSLSAELGAPGTLPALRQAIGSHVARALGHDDLRQVAPAALTTSAARG